MAHFTRTKTDAQWVNGYVPSGADFDSLDTKTVKAINGDEGGVWAPAAAIAIGGAGVKMVGATMTLTAASVALPAAGKKIRLGNNDYPKKLWNLSHMVSTFDALENQVQFGDFVATLGTGDSGVMSARVGATMRIPIRVHDGSTLSFARFHFRVMAVHVAIPKQLPRFRIIRVSLAGVEEALAAPASDIDPFGWFTLLTPVSVSAYNNSTNSQFATYLCTQNNIVDVAKYRYFAEVTDEAGAGAWNSVGGGTSGTNFSHLQLAVNPINDLRFQ